MGPGVGEERDDTKITPINRKTSDPITQFFCLIEMLVFYRGSVTESQQLVKVPAIADRYWYI